MHKRFAQYFHFSKIKIFSNIPDNLQYKLTEMSKLFAKKDVHQTIF